MKYLMVIVAAMVILASLGAVMLSIRDARTIAVTDTYQLTTGAGNYTADIQLSEALWESDTSRVTLSSNTTQDVPVAGNYTAGTRNLAISGLADNVCRTFEVDYYTDGMTDYSWAGTGITFVPTILVLGIILVVVAVVFAAWQSRTAW